MGHLNDIQVYQSVRISTKWTVVTQKGDIVDGRVERGRVCLTQRPGGLDIYLCHEDSDILSPPLELIEELADFCGITYPEHRHLLTHILVQKDVQRITTDLDRRGVTSDVTGFEDEIESPDGKLYGMWRFSGLIVEKGVTTLMKLTAPPLLSPRST